MPWEPETDKRNGSLSQIGVVTEDVQTGRRQRTSPQLGGLPKQYLLEQTCTLSSRVSTGLPDHGRKQVQHIFFLVPISVFMCFLHISHISQLQACSVSCPDALPIAMDEVSLEQNTSSVQRRGGVSPDSCGRFLGGFLALQID